MNDIQFNRLLKNTNNALKGYIKKKGYNQEQLAEKLNISQGSLSAAINGKSRKGIVRIAEFLIKAGHVNRLQLYDEIPEISSDFELSVWNKLNQIEDALKKIVQLQLSMQISNERNFAELKGFTPEEE
jgi:transcriptional regulator with XRE-family HTH domain